MGLYILQDAPFIIVKKNEDGTVSYEGYCVDLIEELARILKFKYEFYQSPDGKYGGITENGTWDGMIREVLNRVRIQSFHSTMLSVEKNYNTMPLRSFRHDGRQSNSFWGRVST